MIFSIIILANHSKDPFLTSRIAPTSPNSPFHSALFCLFQPTRHQNRIQDRIDRLDLEITGN